jgi:hypothetical protein
MSTRPWRAPRNSEGSRSLRTIRVLSTAAAIGFIVFCTNIIWNFHKDAEAQALNAASNLAQATAKNIIRSFDSYNLALENVIAGIRKPYLQTADPRTRRLELFGAFENDAYLSRVFVLDNDGQLIADSYEGKIKRSNFAEKDYFTAVRDGADARLYISKPFRSEFDGNDWVVAMSRGVSDNQGQPGRVAVALLSLGYFQTLFDNMKVDRDDVFGVGRRRRHDYA